MGSTILTEIISNITGGITGIATGIGNGISTLAKSVFLENTGTESSPVWSLSTFGTLITVFAGIGLAISLSKLIVRWVSTLGGSRV